MSGGLMIFLIVVVWLIVLGPVLLKWERPINRAGDGFEKTRVLYSGESGDIPARMGPRLRKSDGRAYQGDESSFLEDAEDLEIVEPEELDEDYGDVLIEDRPDHDAHDQERTISENSTKVVVDVIEGEVISTVEVGVSEHKELEEAPSGSTAASVLSADPGEPLEYSEAFLEPEDLLHREAPALAVVDSAAPTEDVEEGVDKHDSEDYEELTEEELEYAQRRAGRGGWDPEREKRVTADRYQRRRHTLMGLGVAMVVTLVVSLWLGSWWWSSLAAAVALTALYLYALRKQVLAERALRARRIRHLRRARLGVRSQEAQEMNIPESLRRPGAVVMEIDDDSPDFHYLEEITIPEEDLMAQPRPVSRPRRARVS